MRVFNFLLLYHATLAQDGFYDHMLSSSQSYWVDPEDVQALDSKDEDCPVLPPVCGGLHDFHNSG